MKIQHLLCLSILFIGLNVSAQCDLGLNCATAYEQHIPLASGVSFSYSSCNLESQDYSCGSNTVWFSFENIDVQGGFLTIKTISPFVPRICVTQYCQPYGQGNVVFGELKIAVNPGSIYQIGVGIESGQAGEFELILELDKDVVLEECSDGLICEKADEQSLEYYTGSISYPSCNYLSNDYRCGSNTVWFKIENLSSEENPITIRADADFEPRICISEDCENFALNNIGNGELNTILKPGSTHFIGVGINFGETGFFDLIVEKNISTNTETTCAFNAELFAIRSEKPDLNPSGPYCPGETVNFCYSVEFKADNVGEGNNCQWLQGVMPIVGAAWDLDKTPLNVQLPPGAAWFHEGQVSYKVDNPNLVRYTDCNGRLALKEEIGSGNLLANEVLPGGFWFLSPGGGADCSNDGNPNTMWGLPSGCGSTSSVDFCFDLTVKEALSNEEAMDPCFNDLKVDIFTFADGETGCWSNAVCNQDVPAVFSAEANNPIILNGANREICSGESAMIDVITSDLGSQIIYETIGNPNILGDADDGILPTGQGMVIQKLYNLGDQSETITYTFRAQSLLNDQCDGLALNIDVLIRASGEGSCPEAPLLDADNDGYYSIEDCDDNNANINAGQTEIANNDVDEDCDGIALIIDNDGDGYNSDEDCDDASANVNPGQTEIPNNDIDEDCDGIVLVIDEDMDGYNSDEDCDDASANVNPGLMEIPNNEIDEDCDGIALVIDEDMDGFNSDEDCDDASAEINPGQDEIPNNDIDEDCDGIALVIDEDMDGFNSDEDCDDMNADIYPGAVEIPDNGIDEDCNEVDEMTDSIIELNGINVQVFPNPVIDQLSINSEAVDNLQYTLFSIEGKVLLSNKIVRTQELIDLSGFERGLYILRIGDVKGEQTKALRIVKL